MTFKHILLRSVQFVVLTVLFLAFYIGGAMLVARSLPPMTLAEPGPIPSPWDMVVVGAAHTLVIMLMILWSRWRGWRLMVAVALAYYGAITFMTQIETAYFLSSLTVNEGTLRELFLMGMPTAFLFVPLAVVILGRATGPADSGEPNDRLVMPVGQWLWKLALIIVAYWVLYFGAGYFIAWQNPELRAFYSGVDAGNFFLQMQVILITDPWLAPFQALRALLWVACALPVIRMTAGSPWRAALLVGLLLAVPSNLGHLLANPLIPAASVRMSHMIETMSSTFIYGLIIVWLLHRKHSSVADLFGLGSHQAPAQPVAR